jgi:NhaA family Na+:H+ antiporter
VRGTIRFLLENSLFLIFGAVAALIWANTDLESYAHFQHIELFHSSWVGHPHGAERVFTLHFLVNDVLMALFFAIAGKEVWEATLPGGPLNNPKQAAAPLIATIGGMAGPAGVYVLGTLVMGKMAALSNGWAIPTATDIAFSYMVARMVFGSGHPAIPFLLLLAIADDAMGLIIIAVFYPQGPIELQYMAMPIVAMVIGVVLRRARVRSFWPYLLVCGTISWFGFHWANLHPALGLLPIIPVMPHAHVDTGLFDWSKLDADDTLTAFEHWFKNPVELILGAFGLLNAGVAFTAVGDATWLVLAGLLIGKPVGILLCGMAAQALGFKLPEGMGRGDLVVLGCAAGIGFTVAIFVSGVAFPPGPIQDAAKIGALASFGAAVLTFVFAKVFRIQKVVGHEAGHGHGHGH